MQEISPEQKGHLETWAGQRDLLLSEISSLETQKEKLTKEIKEISLSYTDIEGRAHNMAGRIEEMTKKEKELPEIMLKEVSALEKRKSVLEVQLTDLPKMIDILTAQKKSLEDDVSLALANFNLLKDESLTLDKIVDHVTVVSLENNKRIDGLVDSLTKSIEELVAVNKKNVSETNIVIEKLPAMLMEAQKHGLIRPRNNVIRVK